MYITIYHHDEPPSAKPWGLDPASFVAEAGIPLAAVVFLFLSCRGAGSASYDLRYMSCFCCSWKYHQHYYYLLLLLLGKTVVAAVAVAAVVLLPRLVPLLLYHYYHCWSVSCRSLRPLNHCLVPMTPSILMRKPTAISHCYHVQSHVEHLVFLHFHYLSPFKWSEKWGIQPVASQTFPPKSLPVASTPGLPDPRHSRILSRQPFFWHRKRTV